MMAEREFSPSHGLCSKMTDLGIHEDENGTGTPATQVVTHDSLQNPVASVESVPLVTSKLGNYQGAKGRNSSSAMKSKKCHSGTNKMKNGEDDSMETLIARLSEQQALIDKQKNELVANDHTTSQGDQSDSNTGSSLMTPATDSFTPATDNSEEEKAIREQKELDSLKKELEEAKNRIARQEKELSQNRVMQSTLDHLKPGSSVAASKTEQTERAGTHNSDNLMSTRSSAPGPSNDDSKSDVSEMSHLGSMAVGHNNRVCGNGGILANGVAGQANVWNQASDRAWINRPMVPSLPPLMVPQLQQAQLRSLSGPTSPNSSGNGRYANEPVANNRRGTQTNRNAQGMFFPRNQGWESVTNSSEVSPVIGINPQLQAMGMFPGPVNYQPRPIGTPLSPTAAEFTGNGPNGPWNNAPTSHQTYVSPMEPLNYRRLLDRSVTCNWKYIVDKIVCNNDQQASIFLQQKLKVGTVEQKYEIVESIVAQAYPLMVNRFGNFLVQRCFEHGTPDQVVAIANAIRGNTLSLSMDPFGCHVVQKAFDAVPEEYKAIMVHELLRRIPETVIHRYACHVWQKLFELRWSDSPPQIMKYVNEALRGMWHEVALGETGSLVVQNIFENCLEEDKRPCISEVLSSIDIVAHGQFGNWCIQHICEHGAPADRSHAIDHVLRYATEYSMDQFASKVVEKCLKIGGSEFLERYLDRVCEGRADRPRIPLIDISSDQYGNYLIQYILTHANSQHREIVASHIRKHMVSLRGSKFGSRVGMLCSNPAYATRPGPGTGTTTSRFNNSSNTSRFSGQFR